ncbi:MAG: thioredoxin domain-containing protein, partial [Gammaproteobacteria bacterium]|nr:thioredoxin domain-containing protein [Gammaproteobacteria bacterium]
RVTGERRWLQRARQLADRQLELFWDETNGGFFNAPAGAAAWLREKGIVDGAVVSDNGVSIHVLLGLARLTGQADYRRRARQIAAWAMGQLSDSPSDMPYALRAWPALLADVKNEEGSVTD